MLEKQVYSKEGKISEFSNHVLLIDSMYLCIRVSDEAYHNLKAMLQILRPSIVTTWPN